MILCLVVIASAMGVGQISMKADLPQLVLPFVVAGALIVLSVLAVISNNARGQSDENMKNQVDHGNVEAKDEEHGIE